MPTPVIQDATDEDLTLAVHERGDEQAFAVLYERHSPAIYDFVCRMLRDADAAADVTQDTFASAWKDLKRREVTGNVRAWLFTIARNRAINEIRRSSHFLSRRERDRDDDPLLYAQVGESRLSDPEKAVIDQELAELVWSSASALQPREYSLLDMHLRRGLSPEEIADATGASKRNIYVTLFRLRRSLEKSVAGMLMMRRGRRECAELDQILSRADARELTSPVSRLVSKHVDQCGLCQDLRRHIVSPAEIFASLAAIPIPAAVHVAIWNGVVLAVATGAAAAGAGTGALAAVAREPLRWLADKVTSVQGGGAAAAGVAVAAAVALALVLSSGDDAVPPRDPGDVHSSTHRVGQLSASNVIEVAWSRQSDAAGYSIEWSAGSSALPDQTTDLPGDATGARSDPLAAGPWYFNLRTQNADRHWTSTVHLGPFIVGPVAVSAPRTPPATAAPAPTPAPVAAAASATPAPTAAPPRPPGEAGPPSQGGAPPTEIPVPKPPPPPTPAPRLSVLIDIMPGSQPNKFHLRKDHQVPVAAISSASFDAVQADRQSARLLGASAIGFEVRDVDGDGDEDLLLRFRGADMTSTPREIRACLSGRMLDGSEFQGCDQIRFIAHTPDGGEGQARAGFFLGYAGLSACLALIVVRKPRR